MTIVQNDQYPKLLLKTCGDGVKEKTRQVLTHAQNDESHCQGLSSQTQSCNDQGCQGRLFNV